MVTDRFVRYRRHKRALGGKEETYAHTITVQPNLPNNSIGAATN